MLRDLRYASRGLWRSPVFTAATVLALGIAVAANATIFALIDGLWLRPPGVRDPGRLTWIYSTTREDPKGAWSYPEYEALRDGTSTFDNVVAIGGRGSILPNDDGTPELVLVNVVTSNFFGALGVQPAIGRLLGPGDDTPAAQPGIVLGNAFWKRRFGADPSVVGRSVRLMRGGPVAVTVLGVLPASFRALDAGDRDLWMSTATWTRLSSPGELQDRAFRWFQVLGMRKPGIATAAAGTDVGRIAHNLAADFAATNAGRGARVMTDLSRRVEEGGTSAAALLGLVLLVVVITCVNVANMLLARGTSRSREMAVRAAIGAGRGRLVRELMAESAIIGALGALTGGLLSVWLVRLLPAVIGAPPGFASSLVFAVDSRVFVFTLVVTLVTTGLFGIAPSLLAARADVVSLIKAGGGGTRPRRGATRLLVMQVAVSLVLLCGAALLSRSFAETQAADLGMTRGPVLTAWVINDVPEAIGADAVRRLEALPGARRAAIALRAPLSLSGSGYARPLAFPDRPVRRDEGLPEVKFNAVSASYFEVMETRLVRGRLFGEAEERDGELVMVVNEQFARSFYPGREAVGAQVRVGGPDAPLHRIVGIVRNAPIADIGEPPEPYFYVPYWRGRYGEITFMVRTASDPGALAASVRSTLRQASPRLEPRRIISMQQYIDYSASPYRATATLAAVLGGIGLLLTLLGVYGVMAYRTARRTREIGIRLALGAKPREVLRMVLREGVSVAMAGIALGIPLALAGSRLLSSLLFRVSPWDTMALAGAAVILLGSVCAATAVPAWRAARVDPSVTLRDA